MAKNTYRVILKGIDFRDDVFLHSGFLVDQNLLIAVPFNKPSKYSIECRSKKSSFKLSYFLELRVVFTLLSFVGVSLLSDFPKDLIYVP